MNGEVTFENHVIRITGAITEAILRECGAVDVRTEDHIGQRMVCGRWATRARFDEEMDKDNGYRKDGDKYVPIA